MTPEMHTIRTLEAFPPAVNLCGFLSDRQRWAHDWHLTQRKH